MPESKFYSPRPDAESRHQPSPAAGIPEAAATEEPVSQSRVVFDPEQDDFLVLPGESLAKYTGSHGKEPEEQSAVEATLDRGSDVEPAGDEAPSDGPFETDHSREGATQRMLAAAEAAEAADGQEPAAEEGVVAGPEVVVVAEVTPEPAAEELVRAAMSPKGPWPRLRKRKPPRSRWSHWKPDSSPSKAKAPKGRV